MQKKIAISLFFIFIAFGVHPVGYGNDKSVPVKEENPILAKLRNSPTSEEKSFVQWFADNMMTKKQSGKTELEEKNWSDIFLARNEKAVKLYSWFAQNGEGFEPDFVLFMKKDEIEYVFYIEPKGEHLLLHDKWKEEFLLEIESVVFTQQTKMSDNKNWRLIGLPFYNENNTKQQFAKTFNEKMQ